MRKSLISICALAFALPQPVFAGTSDSEAALIGAAISQVLGGKTTLSDNAGEIEGWMVSARLLESAAILIKGKVSSDKGLILVGTEAPNLGLPNAINAQIDKFNIEFEQLCKLSPLPPTKGLFPNNVVTSLAAAISGAPKSETEISGYTLKPGDLAIVDALMGQLNGEWTRLEDMSVKATNSELLKNWEKLRSSRFNKADACSKSDSGKNLVSRFDAMDTKINAFGDKGEASLLEQAARIDAALPEGALVLRVHIEQAGGSITNTNNIFTRLGLPAVQVTGAIVIGYRLIDPSTGRTPKNKAGLIVCHSPRKTLGSIHRGILPAVDTTNCKDSASDGETS